MKKVPILAAVILCLVVFNDGPSMTQRAPASPEQMGQRMPRMDEAKFKDWLSRWEKEIIKSSAQRYCSKELGEEMGWLMMPFLKGYYYGYLVTSDSRWVDLLVACTDSWIKRAVKEPDGYLGWPKVAAASVGSIDNLDDFNADSLLGEAMTLRYVVLMANEILKTPALKEKYGTKAESYIKLSEQVFEKWDRRGAWRDTEGGGTITVVLPFGIDEKTGTWTEGYDKRNSPSVGFSHQNNKANAVASWLVAMFDATGKVTYKERAERWFRLMKSRMKLKDDGTYQIWNYWQPAGPWDYKLSLIPKHWIGIHPKAGYYHIDVEGIVTAYEHSLVFSKEDVDRLIKTAIAENRIWDALAPYSADIRSRFEVDHRPDSWHGLSTTPWYLALQARL